MYLAKSNGETIVEHSNKLIGKLEDLCRLYPRSVEGINKDLLKDACRYHDIGKANREFQERMKRISLGEKVYRKEEEVSHAILSWIMIDREALLEKYSAFEVKLLEMAVLNHHGRPNTVSGVIDVAYKKQVQKAVERLNLDEELPLLYRELNLCGRGEAFRIKMKRLSPIVDDKWKDGLSEDERFKYERFLGLLMRVDYSASGGYAIEHVNDYLSYEVDNYFNENGYKYNDMQKRAIISNGQNGHKETNLVLIGQTGLGKTEASLLWIGNRKGIITLPLQTAINSMYTRIKNNYIGKERSTFSENVKGYKQDGRVEERLGVLHGHSKQLYLPVEGINEERVNYSDYVVANQNFTLPLTVTTLDQIFRFVFSYEKYEYISAILGYSNVVIDEIQVYSPDLLAYTLEGLRRIEKLGGRYLVMSATVSPYILSVMKDKGLNFETSEEYRNEDKLERHSVKIRESGLDVMEILANYVKYRGKVLVICNTIKKAKEVYGELRELFSDEEEIHLLHSKFTRGDRHEKEKRLIEMAESSKEEKRSGIWITTQLVEASLDIDFDVLYTELSELTSLYQRMGRCYRNRNYNYRFGEYNVYVYVGSMGKNQSEVAESSIEETNLSKLLNGKESTSSMISGWGNMESLGMEKVSKEIRESGMIGKYKEIMNNLSKKGNQSVLSQISGVPYIYDITLFYLSRYYLKKEIEGIFSEEEKYRMLNKVYTMEKLKHTVYHREYLAHSKKLEAFSQKSGGISKEEAIRKFRDIDSIKFIPRVVYEENKARINHLIAGILSEGVYLDKIRYARYMDNLEDYMVSVQGTDKNYILENHLVTEEKYFGKYREPIKIVDIGYNKTEGIYW